MTATAIWRAGGKAPDHIPQDLVRSFDFYAEPGLETSPFRTVSTLHADAQRVFYNTNDPQCGGSWVVTRAEDFKTVMSHPETFSSLNITGFSALLGQSWPLVPLEIDPPQHHKYRQILNPSFSPRAIDAMSDGIRARAQDLLDLVAAGSSCEFMSAFGQPFPVSVFMQLMGLPDSETDQFLQWEFDLLHNLDLAVKARAAGAIREYLLQLMRERRSHPKDDLATVIVQARYEDRPLTDDEVLGAYYLMFVGGLDTVAASLGLFFNHLAQHPQLQDRLRAEPARIPRAVEEFVRAFSPVTTRRIVTQDCDLAGVAMKAGDWVTCVTALASLDPDEYQNPLEVDLERPHPRHFGFSMGPHFCIGMHLARREIVLALEGWLSRVPTFRLKPGFEARMHGGPVMGLETLELEWG